MKKVVLAGFILFLLAGSFLVGSWYSHSRPDQGSVPSRKILYYIDPMHPSYKSDKPGIAPDCGMELVPVYDDGGVGGSVSGSAGTLPGAIQISADRQQLIGVRISIAEKSAKTHSLRILGRVAPDESRLYRINATTDVWVREVFPPTTGSMVKKDEPLLAYWTNAFLAAANAYLYALDTQDRHRRTADISRAQADNLESQMRSAVGNLINIGVSESQIKEMERTRKASALIEIRSPVDGFVLARSVSPGQFLPAGSELYRVADFRKVWILAEIFENEGLVLTPGMRVKVTHPQTAKILDARVTDVPPQFDPSTRTLKARLEADNAGLLLRPDMFVDVEVPAARPAAIVVPMDAVVDSGTKKTVYVDKGNGTFEPRKVETGWRMGDQVEIVKGLMAGEKIVVSGTFLIDSESRMKAAAAGIYGETSECPVCGMEVDITKAKAAGRTSEFRGNTYYFCADEDRVKFDKEPTKYTLKNSPGPTTAAEKRLEQVEWKGAKAREPKQHEHPRPSPEGAAAR